MVADTAARDPAGLTGLVCGLGHDDLWDPVRNQGVGRTGAAMMNRGGDVGQHLCKSDPVHQY